MDGPDSTKLHYLAMAGEWRADRYYTYDLMTELTQGWVAEYPGLASCERIGQSGEGRDIWAVTVTKQATGPDHEKPTYYIDANSTRPS